MKKITAIILSFACITCTLTGCGQSLGNSTVTSSSNSNNKGDTLSENYAIATAEYPEMPEYPDEAKYTDSETGEFDSEGYQEAYQEWIESKIALLDQDQEYKEGLSGFYADTIREFLSDSNGENKIYSPLNVYMALSMLAELTDGNSRQQILDLLCAEDIETVRTKAAALWNANYCDDGAATSILANSVWLNENVEFKQDTLNTLAETYYASSFKGEMGSAEYTKALQSWINEQTEGLLEEQASGLELTEETILALASTIYYKAAWSDEFWKENNETDIFHADSGDIECEFMCQQSDSLGYYEEEGFSAVYKSLDQGGGMWLILPDENSSVDDILQTEGVLEDFFDEGTFESGNATSVKLYMPKFDVVSETDLISGLKDLGVTDIFDSTVSDFSPMTDDSEELYVSQAEHTARVTVDEEGVTAAAYTVMGVSAASMPAEEIIVEFRLDRPFLFILTGEDGSPLFTGIVNQPV